MMRLQIAGAAAETAKPAGALDSNLARRLIFFAVNHQLIAPSVAQLGFKVKGAFWGGRKLIIPEHCLAGRWITTRIPSLTARLK
ncbi:MAG: hypothetical protein OD918_00140 [Gammaproteobacteria bacterium]